MSETKSTQLKNNKNGEDSDGDDDIDEHEQPLNKSLTSMDWLQKLNAEYVTQSNSDTSKIDPKGIYYRLIQIISTL